MASRLIPLADMPLTDQELALVEAIATLKMPQRLAARYAGYASQGAVQAALNKPLVVRAIAEQREINADKLNITRDKVNLGIMEAIDLARTVGDPASMIRGHREIGLMAGFYDATPDDPRRGSQLQRQMMDRIKDMTDDELIVLQATKIEGGVTIEHEAQVVAGEAEVRGGVPREEPRRDQPQAAREVPRARTKAKAPKVSEKLGRHGAQAQRKVSRTVSHRRGVQA